MLKSWEEMFKEEGFLFRPIAGGDGTEEVKEEAPVEEPKVEPAKSLEPVDEPAKAPTEIEQINNTLKQQTETLNKLAKKLDSSAESQEWTLEELRKAELKVYAGEYSQDWLPLINEKRSLLQAKSVAAEERKAYEKENAWNQTIQRFNNGMSRARDEFGPEVEDTNSKLFKTAQNILMNDPGYRKVKQLQADGKSLTEIDPSILDPDLQFKSFEIAHSRISRMQKDAPDPNPRPSSTALGGQSLLKSEESNLARLEERARETGEQRDWIALDKARLRAQGRIK